MICRTTFHIVLGFLAGGLLTSCASVEEHLPITLSNANMLAVLNTIDQLQIRAGELGRQKAASRKLEAFAVRLTQEHTQAMQIRHDLAEHLAIQPSEPQLGWELKRRRGNAEDQLQQRSGQEFDEAYIKNQITIHEELVRFVEDAEHSMGHPAVRQHLRGLRPDLLSHLSAVRALERDRCPHPTMGSADEHCRFIR